MKSVNQSDDQPINLEESSSTELKRVVVSDDSPSTRTPEMPRKPHARTNHRELLHQAFGPDHPA